MFNLVVLCTFVAAAAATGIVPLTYSAAIFPGTTTISRLASSVVHPTPLISTPLVYSSPLYTHLIKKRSAVFAPSIIAPSTYIARTPLVTSYAAPWATTYSVAAPLTTAIASPFYGAHLIKKRSAPLLLRSSYVSPALYAAPLLRTPLHVATPYFSTPIGYSHLIKKRSLALASYITPAAVSHQSRVDFRSTPALVSTSYSAPLIYNRFF